jgi:hypothetical protein
VMSTGSVAWQAESAGVSMNKSWIVCKDSNQI